MATKTTTQVSDGTLAVTPWSVEHDQPPLGADWRASIDFGKLRDDRLAKLQAAMRETNVDGLMLFRYDNIRYAVAHHPLYFDCGYITRNLAVVAADGPPVLHVASGDYGRVSNEMNWIPDGHLKPLATLEDEGVAVTVVRTVIRETLDELGLSSSRIAIDGCLFHVWRALEEEFPTATFTHATETLRKAKMVKTSEEIKIARRGCAIVDEGMMVALESVRHGVRECQVAGAAAKAMFDLGAEHLCQIPIVASGPNVAPLHRMATDRIMRPGDMVMLDIGAYVMGHAHEFARTEIVPGRKPSDLQRRVYAVVFDAMLEIIEFLKPGRTTWELNRAARGVIEAAGFAEYGFLGQLGHSQGTSVQEPPTVAETVSAGEPEIEIVPGMIFAMEPGIFIPQAEPGGVGCRIENVILTTESGNEVLTRAPYSEALL